ncbi:hypothetical protein [Paenibacillus sp. N3.4]|uniref:hypothetical protein n=1 Tax=Paenibacillus sp. N3.4 TaxID=2603222 RepID=UPI00165027F6|nr:hypothetical protein [Paenibacillus sp. N3.4]
MDGIIALTAIIAILVLSIAFRQINLHFKLKDLIDVTLSAERGIEKNAESPPKSDTNN